jgi:hypothetical protein
MQWLLAGNAPLTSSVKNENDGVQRSGADFRCCEMLSLPLPFPANYRYTNTTAKRKYSKAWNTVHAQRYARHLNCVTTIETILITTDRHGRNRTSSNRDPENRDCTVLAGLTPDVPGCVHHTGSSTAELRVMYDAISNCVCCAVCPVMDSTENSFCNAAYSLVSILG